jgi:hypothetical protein
VNTLVASAQRRSACATRITFLPNQSIERTATSTLRVLAPSAHLQR